MGLAAARFSEQQTHAHIWPHGPRRCPRNELCVRNQEPTTVCPSGLRGWTQVPLAQAVWVQIPQLSASLAACSRVLLGAADARAHIWPHGPRRCAHGQSGFCLPSTNNSLPERSTGVDSSSTSAGCVGSNPTGAMSIGTVLRENLIGIAAAFWENTSVDQDAGVCPQQAP